MNTLVNQNDKDLAMFESDLSIESAMNGTIIQTMTKQDKKSTIKMLVYLISRMNDSFNMNNKLNDNQILMLSVDLLDVFGYETIEDVVMMFKMARRGQLGSKIYRLDSQTIFEEWVPNYLELKAEEREKQHIDFKENNKMDFNSKSNWNDENKKKLKIIISDINYKNLKEPELKGSMKNDTEFIKELEKDCKKLSKKSLTEIIKKWSKMVHYKKYVDILKSELEAKNKTSKVS